MYYMYRYIHKERKIDLNIYMIRYILYTHTHTHQRRRQQEKPLPKGDLKTAGRNEGKKEGKTKI
jgi:hypothetical protein